LISDINDNATAVNYEIYKADLSNPGVSEYHSKLQLFLLWFIDGSSFIELTDPRWEAFYIYQKIVLSGESYYSLVGFATVYKFFAYPDRIRKRISQVLILPPYQRSGHGTHLLRAIYNSVNPSEVKDITVEDPSDQFKQLRDAFDVALLQKHGWFQNPPLDKLDKSTIEEIRDKLKLTPIQIKHCYDIFQSKYVDRKREEEYKSYRLDCKRKLFQMYADAEDKSTDSPDIPTSTHNSFKEDRPGDNLVKEHRGDNNASAKEAPTNENKQKQKDQLEKLFQEQEKQYQAVLEKADSILKRSLL